MLYVDTGVQIVDICLASRPHNGGLIDLEELCALLSKKRRAARERITEDDCRRAIGKLKVGGYSIILLGLELI
jgi:ESCRT-II complex subunit VPS22